MEVKSILNTRQKKVKFFSHIKGTETTSTDFHLLLHQRVTELQTNIFKKIALHFAPFMI